MSVGIGQQITGLVDSNHSIVQSILAGDSQGGELLSRKYARGIRFLIGRSDSRQTTGVLDEVLQSVSEYVRQGRLQSPSDLPSCVRDRLNAILTAKGQKVGGAAATDENPAVLQAQPESENLDRSLGLAEAVQAFGKDMEALESKEREILTRSYVDGQDARDICKEMKLTGMELSFLKGIAKRKLAMAVANMKDAVQSLASTGEGRAPLPALQRKGHAA
jgi:DNA-directed RNA polymerase specialized sigma24 family protein